MITIEHNGKRRKFYDPEQLYDYVAQRSITDCYILRDGRRLLVSMDDIERWARTGKLTGAIEA